MSFEEEKAALEWKLAEQFGWSLEYIRELSLSDLGNYLEIEEAKAKIQETTARKQKMKKKSKKSV